jgi:hypothetical protein
MSASFEHNLQKWIALVLVVWLFSFTELTAATHKSVRREQRQATYCNPVDLPYRFQLAGSSRREAADPTVITFRGEYWLFPSVSGGYWHSKDVLHWSFIEGKGYPVEAYAPTALVMDGKVYLTMGHTTKLFVTDDPLSGRWKEAADFGREYNDPALFLDDDGRLYMYYGLSGEDVLHITELDPKDGFKAIRTVSVPESRSPATRGWEVPGDSNTNFESQPWIEGSWMNKYKGRYYLQYAAPGTEFKTYADGVLTSREPTGPFSYADYSPFSFKPAGFISGAGHSSTFAGLDGRFWHFSTMSISMREPFERRLGMFPAHFTKEGALVTDTYLGDYPHYVEGDRGLTGWMLLSRKKATSASSTIEGHAPGLAVDEDIRTWWSAKTGNPGEWFQIDLGRPKVIEAIQINFADEGSTAHGRSQDVYKYILEVSGDADTWSIAIDHGDTGRDSPDDFEVLPRALTARYVRIRNIHSPNEAKFSLSDLRVFGKGNVPMPDQVSGVTIDRDPADPRHATIHWQAADRAEFYVVRLGVNANELTQNYQIYDGATSAEIRSLSVGVSYCVAVDAVNERGVTKAVTTTKMP